MSKTDFDLVDAYWMETQNEDKEMSFPKVIYDGTYFSFTGYSRRFGTRMDRNPDRFAFV